MRGARSFTFLGLTDLKEMNGNGSVFFFLLHSHTHTHIHIEQDESELRKERLKRWTIRTRLTTLTLLLTLLTRRFSVRLKREEKGKKKKERIGRSSDCCVQ